jgi:hypothetical protein
MCTAGADAARPELFPVLPDDRSRRFEANADGAALVVLLFVFVSITRR